MLTFTPAQRELLKKFVSHPDGDAYAVFQQAMPGMIGAAFARYSRSQDGFRSILLKEFIEDGQLDHQHADELITRILIAFGDDSVQELESAYVSVEGVSNVLTKLIEDCRLLAYIEKSSRYVWFNKLNSRGQYNYLREPAIMASRHAADYEATMDFVFTTYDDLIEPLQEYFRRRKSMDEASYEIRKGRKITLAQCQDDDERRDFERTYKMDIRTKACDTLRILLPASTQTNVGIHGNGRNFEQLLRKLYSSDLPEAQEMAVKIRTALDTVIPRYVQRAGRSEYLVQTRRAMQALTDKLLKDVAPGPIQTGVRLVDRNAREAGQLAAMLFPFARHSMWQLIDIVNRMLPDGRRTIRKTYIGSRETRRDRVGRALEFGYPWEIELVIVLGFYRDLHRHRMMTQERQLYTTDLGFTDKLDDLREAGFEPQVRACAERVNALYAKIRADLGAETAQYVVLLGHNIRCRFGFNDREAQHLLELRTGPQGHRSYRLVGQEIYRQMVARDGDRIKDMLQFVDLNDYDWPRGDSEAGQRAKEAKLNP